MSYLIQDHTITHPYHFRIFIRISHASIAIHKFDIIGDVEHGTIPDVNDFHFNAIQCHCSAEVGCQAHFRIDAVQF